MSLEFIAEITANATDTQDLIFTSIPQTYESLRIIGVGNGQASISAGLNGVFSLVFNQDTSGSKHAWQRTAADYNSQVTNVEGIFNGNYAQAGYFTGSAPDSGYYPANYITDIYNYKGVAATGDVQYFSQSTAATYNNNYSFNSYTSGTYNNGTTPITSLQLNCGGANWMRYTKFSLYGRD